MQIKTPKSVPPQWDAQFIQGMVDRMAQGYYTYGHIKDARKQDFRRSLEARLRKYKLDGNTEWLIDAANFLMIEFMYPRHPDAHFRSTDTNESPGVYREGEINPTKRRNTEI